MIGDAALPATQQSLSGFISLCGFYAKFCLWFETELTPLRRIVREYKQAAIPGTAWTPDRVALFNKIKRDITLSPCLKQADCTKPFFLKTDWSATGMGWILMQAADNAVSQAALKDLENGKPCRFDETCDGPRLQPILFGLHWCKGKECDYHSMVGEAASGRCAIGKLRRYLWGAHFYWIVNCKALEAILDYRGDNRLLSRWAQELLGYSFTLVHRPALMMVDVNNLSRFDGMHPLVARYEKIAAGYAAVHLASHPWAYETVDVNDINQSGSIGPGRQRKRRRAVGTGVHPVTSGSQALVLCRRMAPILFAPMPKGAAPSTGAESLPLDDALHSAVPWWLSVDCPVASTRDLLQSLHCRADMTFVVTGGDRSVVESLLCPQDEVHPDMAAFVCANSSSDGRRRPILGADLHCPCQDRRKQLAWA